MPANNTASTANSAPMSIALSVIYPSSAPRISFAVSVKGEINSSKRPNMLFPFLTIRKKKQYNRNRCNRQN